MKDFEDIEVFKSFGRKRDEFAEAMAERVESTRSRGMPMFFAGALMFPITLLCLVYRTLSTLFSFFSLWIILALDMVLHSFLLARYLLEVVVILLWTAFRLVKKLSQPK